MIKFRTQVIKGIVLTQLIVGTQLAASPLVKTKKNILFITVDDLKPVLGCYGDELAVTPNIDYLASKGTVFTHSYCQQALSGPSRSSLLTGLCPDRNGVRDLKTLIRTANPDVVTLPQYFKNGGYTTIGIGKIFDSRTVEKGADKLSWSLPYMNYNSFYNDEVGEPLFGEYQSEESKKQFDFLMQEALNKGMSNSEANNYVKTRVKASVEALDLPDDAYPDGAIAKGAMQIITNYKGDNPFFLAVGFKRPHLPFCAPLKYWNLYERAKIPVAQNKKKVVGTPDYAYHKADELCRHTDIKPLVEFSDISNVVLPDAKAQELIHGYYATVSFVDEQIGKLIKVLEEKGLLENTIIVIWGDHGYHLGDHGLWNKHTNFEQAARVPMLIIDPELKSSKVKCPVESLDIYPTICELAGMEQPDNLDGVTLVPLMKGEKDNSDIRYAATQHPRDNKMGYSIRTSRYRYTIWVDWMKGKLNIDKIFAEELYDYTKDPLESTNLLDDPSYQQVVKQMRRLWEDYIVKRIN